MQKNPVKGLGECALRIGEREGDTLKVLRRNPPEEGALYPLMNLDIYSSIGSSRIPIEKYGAGVTVTIPYTFLEGINKSRPGREQFLFIYDDESKTWISIEDPDSGIREVKRGKNAITFTIERWPVDDRMISCGP